jgi:hypothetical protein
MEGRKHLVLEREFAASVLYTGPQGRWRRDDNGKETIETRLHRSDVRPLLRNNIDFLLQEGCLRDAGCHRDEFLKAIPLACQHRELNDDIIAQGWLKCEVQHAREARDSRVPHLHRSHKRCVCGPRVRDIAFRPHDADRKLQSEIQLIVRLPLRELNAHIRDCHECRWANRGELARQVSRIHHVSFHFLEPEWSLARRTIDVVQQKQLID